MTHEAATMGESTSAVSTESKSVRGDWRAETVPSHDAIEIREQNQ